MGLHVLHSPSFLAPHLRWRTRHLVTVHDVTFFTMPHLHSTMRRSAPFRYAVERCARVAHIKNLELLVGAYGRSKTGVHLVLAGRLGWRYEGLLAEVKKQGLAGRVHLTGYVSPEDLPWL